MKRVHEYLKKYIINYVNFGYYSGILFEDNFVNNMAFIFVNNFDSRRFREAADSINLAPIFEESASR